MSSRLLQALRSPSASTLKSSWTRAPRRFNSSSTQQKAQEKAQEALASAQKGLEKALEAAKKASGTIGERAGNLLGSYREPLLYNLEVGRELLKQIYVAERLAPPSSVAQVTGVYQNLWSRISNPTYWREVIRTGEYKQIGVYAVEAYGIFKLGEILGRRHLVGYKLD